MKQSPRLKEKYEKEIREALMQEFNIKNKLGVPKLTKIVVNVGTGDLLKNDEMKEKLMKDLAFITGQKPKIQPAKKSIAGFNLREGNPVGLTCTLRGRRMYHFLDKLIAITLPRVRDFRGLALKSFDGRGNYTIGLSEYTIFLEIDLAKVGRSTGVEISIVTNADSLEKSKRLLELLGMPFAKN